MDSHLEEILLTVSKSKLIDEGELKQAYRLVISSIQEGLNISRVGIWFLKTDYSEISCQLLVDTFHNTEIESLIISATDYPNYFNALKKERAILAHDAHTHEATYEFSAGYLSPLSISSMLDVPIRHTGKVIGIICCEHIGDKRQWTEDEATFAGSMADLIGRAINANAYKNSADALQQINAQLESMVEKRTNQLVESEKMAALGNLVAGVAHEVNTPLGIGITTSSAIQDELDIITNAAVNNSLTQQQFKSYLQKNNEYMTILTANLQRAANLISNFKQTAVAHSDTNLHVFDLKEILEFLILSLKPETKKLDVEIQLNIPSKLSLYSSSSAWTQVLSNLILNSCNHAFDTIEKPHIMIDISTDEENIYMDYKDNGCGISEDKLKKVIEPFYTTKRGRGGTGLGMSIVYNLINEHLDGSIELKSDKNVGLNIHITCPKKIIVS